MLYRCLNNKKAGFMKKEGYEIDLENSLLSESFENHEKKTLKIYYKKA